MPVYKGESVLPTRDINLMSLLSDTSINILPTELIVSDVLSDLFIIK